MKVMIAVTHLLGSGHLARALTLARAFRAAGHQAIVVSGGMPVPQLDRGDVPVVQLPPLRSDGTDFTQLLDVDDQPATEPVLAARRAGLLGSLSDLRPDVLITELFPFGRRSLRREFTDLLDAARTLTPRPLICASVRDILAPPSKPAKAVWADAQIAQYYDAVLVHSDAAVMPLDLSWPVSEALAGKLRYTGFVAPPMAMPHPEGVGKGEIIVSAGGGDVGEAVFTTALAAAAMDPTRRWRILVGGGDTARLAASAGRNVTVEPARPDFRQMLHHAAASVSLCGYNTALDILQAGCRAVFVPFDAGNEVEQGIRAAALGHLPGIATVCTADLSGDILLDTVNRVMCAPARPPMPDGFDGAAQTVRIVETLRPGNPV